MKRMYILVNKYPNNIEPNVCVFIQQLVWEFADLGYDCNVICPLPINLNRKYLQFPNSIVENTDNNRVRVFYPRYISFGQSGKLFQKLRVKFTTWLYTNACDKILKKQNITSDDILYSHFICPSGVAASILAKKYKVKSFLAFGESMYQGDKKYGNSYLKNKFKNLTGIIAVSTQNKNFLVDAGIIDESKIEIFPNGYRKERFYKIDKINARKHFEWDNKKFIVGFCGSFDDRKGILRLDQAIDEINDKTVLFACAGKGDMIPKSDKCIMKEPINNNELIYFYNAIDVFCLPTKHEGCCNAIVEAMACGCPIISSDREFNYDILDKNNSIMINPDNVNEIKKAIEDLFNNKNKLDLMSINCIKKSQKLTLSERAKRIIEFIENK